MTVGEDVCEEHQLAQARTGATTNIITQTIRSVTQTFARVSPLEFGCLL